MALSQGKSSRNDGSDAEVMRLAQAVGHEIANFFPPSTMADSSGLCNWLQLLATVLCTVCIVLDMHVIRQLLPCNMLNNCSLMDKSCTWSLLSQHLCCGVEEQFLAVRQNASIATCRVSVTFYQFWYTLSICTNTPACQYGFSFALGVFVHMQCEALTNLDIWCLKNVVCWHDNLLSITR